MTSSQNLSVEKFPSAVYRQIWSHHYRPRYHTQSHLNHNLGHYPPVSTLAAEILMSFLLTIISVSISMLKIVVQSCFSSYTECLRSGSFCLPRTWKLSCLDYCDSLHSCWNKPSFSRLQLIQNAAAKLIRNLNERVHLTPIVFHYCYILSFCILLDYFYINM